MGVTGNLDNCLLHVHVYIVMDGSSPESQPQMISYEKHVQEEQESKKRQRETLLHGER